MISFLVIVYCIFAFLVSEVLRKSLNTTVILDPKDLQVIGENPVWWFVVRSLIGLAWFPILMIVVISMYLDTFKEETDEDDNDDLPPNVKTT